MTLRQTHNLLKLTYGFVLILTGLDKFTNLLSSWTKYVAAWIPIDAVVFMKITGIIEIVIGIIVLMRPRIGSYFTGILFIGSALLLISGGHFFEVAVCDFVMAMGAFALAQLSKNDKLVGSQTKW